MAGSRPYRRHRGSRGGRGEPQGDAIVSAITVQVVICIGVLLAGVLVKNVDETRYNTIRGQYDLMVTDPAAGGEVLEELSGAGNVLQRAFDSIESGITSIVDRFAGGGGQTLPPVEEGLPDDEPEQAAPPREDDTGGAAEAFDFDYLSASEIVYTALGAGGAAPVTTGADGSAARSAPENFTFAQLEVLGKVKPPVTGLITSEFSYRVHPVNGGEDYHNGMDIAAEEGRDILAALPGEVIEVGEDDIYGKYIKVKHAMHLETFYAHCSQILASPGDAVRQGERIAMVGSTGLVTGPHLHFSVIVNGQYADPYWVLKDSIELVG